MILRSWVTGTSLCPTIYLTESVTTAGLTHAAASAAERLRSYGQSGSNFARLGRAVTLEHIDPKRILAVTFTRAAAGETRHKLEKRGIRSDQLPDVRTLHSKAVGLLRRHSARLGL